MLWAAVEIHGTLVVRWHEGGVFDVSLVPLGPPPATPVPIRRVGDAADLRQVLAEFRLEPGRVEEVVRSRHVLQSLPVRVDRGTAGRLGLVRPTRFGRALELLGRLTPWARGPA